MTEIPLDDYRALHASGVWADRSARDARLEVTGPDAADWLQGLLTQDVKVLEPGEGAHAAYLTPQGRMVADLRVFRREAAFLLETPATARATLLARLDQFVIMEDVTVTDVTDTLGCLTVLGPVSAEWASACTGVPAAVLESLEADAHVVPRGDHAALVAATREFGVAGYDLIAPAAVIDTWRRQLEARGPASADPLLEVARIEAGRPRFGVDMRDDTIPLEAGLDSRAISFDKGCYVGQEIVIRILHRGQGRVARRLVWIEAAQSRDGDQAWQPGDEVIRDGKAVGAVTSACWSPARHAELAIAMVHRDAAEPATPVSIDGRPGVVRKLPDA